MSEIELDDIARRQLHDCDMWYDSVINGAWNDYNRKLKAPNCDKRNAWENSKRLLDKIDDEKIYRIYEIFKQFNERQEKKVPKIIKTPWGVLFA